MRAPNTWILRWWGTGLWCSHLPPVETCKWKLLLCSSHDKGFRRTCEEEKHPEIRTVRLFGTCTDVRYMRKGIGLRKRRGLGKILLGRFINRFVMDQNASTVIQALRVCQSGWNSRDNWDRTNSVHKVKHNPVDSLTRGLDLNYLMKWCEGPSLLKQSGSAFKTTPKILAMRTTLQLQKRRKRFGKRRKLANITLPLRTFIRCITSNNNPANALTRGRDLNYLMKWSEGPSFLELPEAEWPSFQDHTQDTTHEDDLTASKEKKTFRKEKKAGKHHTASADVYSLHHVKQQPY